MTAIAEWLVLAVVSLPCAGVVTAVVLLSRRDDRADSATASVLGGMFGSFLASLGLLALMGGAFDMPFERAVWRLGTALELSGTRPVKMEWAWSADVFAAGWTAALSGLAWGAASLSGRDSFSGLRTQFAVWAGILHLAIVALVFSPGLVQMLFFWGLIALATGRLMASVSTTADVVHALRRTLLTGLATDGFLILAVLLMSVSSGSLIIDDVLSSDGLAQLSQRNTALPGFIGCLLVLSVLGRCGLFPCFGWHRGAAAWERATWLMIYLVGYVPSAVWLLFRFEPLVASSSESLAMLGGLGTLGALLGAFVACSQPESRVGWSFLVTAQIGVVLTAVSCGLFDLDVLRAIWFGSGNAAPNGIELGRVLFSQLAVIAGAFIVRQSARATTAAAKSEVWYEPLAQLSRQRLNIDEVGWFAVEAPLCVWMQLARFVDRMLAHGLFPWLTIRLPGWFGRQLESFYVGRVEFDLAAALMGVSAVLLTLVLVS